MMTIWREHGFPCTCTAKSILVIVMTGVDWFCVSLHNYHTCITSILSLYYCVWVVLIYLATQSCCQLLWRFKHYNP